MDYNGFYAWPLQVTVWSDIQSSLGFLVEEHDSVSMDYSFHGYSIECFMKGGPIYLYED